jgi:hypothetical protein
MPCQEAASLKGSVLSAMPNGRHAVMSVYKGSRRKIPAGSLPPG